MSEKSWPPLVRSNDARTKTVDPGVKHRDDGRADSSLLTSYVSFIQDPKRGHVPDIPGIFKYGPVR